MTNVWRVSFLTFISRVNTDSMSCGKYNTLVSFGEFQDSDFAGDLEDSKSTSGGELCIFGSHTFVP